MQHLRKRDAETLLRTYDDDPVAALTKALRIVLGRPEADYRTLVSTAPFDDDRRARLLAGDVATLDALARELNETRMLQPGFVTNRSGRRSGDVASEVVS